MGGEEEVRVSFGVREMFTEIRTKLDTIEGKLSTKADVILVQSLQDQVRTIELHGTLVAQRADHGVAQLEERLTTLDKSVASQHAVDQALGRARVAVITGTISLVAALVVLVTSLLQLHV